VLHYKIEDVEARVLDAANASTERVHTISARCILLNDAYKDMTRDRSALTRAYSTAREKPSAGVNTSAIDSAASSFNRMGRPFAGAHV
jgi:methyl-accepting chemotaxis protein